AFALIPPIGLSVMPACSSGCEILWRTESCPFSERCASVNAMSGNASGLLVFLAIIGCGQHVEQSAERSSKRLDIAKDFLRKNELEAAEAECNKAIAYNGKNDEAYVVRGLVSMVRAFQTKKTMEIDGCLTGLDAEATDRDLQLFLSKADLDFERA